MHSCSQKTRRRPWALLSVIGLVLLIGGLWWLRPAGPRLAADVEALVRADDVMEAPRAPQPGFLGPKACAACHEARVAEFHATRHARACRPPSPDVMPAGFDDTFSLRTRFAELSVEVSRAGDAFFQTAVWKTPKGEKRTKSAVHLVYGSGGKADEIYFTWRGDALHELPAAWLHPLQSWGESPFSGHLGEDFTRVTTPRCLECHNTWFSHQAGTANSYGREHYILGVTCERCHGPGQEHVGFHRANPEDTVAKAITHPGRLTRERELDVCGQCHSNANKHRRTPFSYRPGEPLDAYYRTAAIPHREDDRVADQVKYLGQSKCFQKSDTLTCTTCHDPHRPEAPATVHRGCLKCHQPENCADRGRLPEQVRHACVDCHMPRFTRIQVHFHTADDRYVPVMRPAEHRIGVYPAAKQEVLLQWRRGQADAAPGDGKPGDVKPGDGKPGDGKPGDGKPGDATPSAAELSAALVKHWRGEAQRYRGEHRFLAAIGALREALRIQPDESTRAQLDEVIKIQMDFDTAWDEALHDIEQRRFAGALTKLQAALTINPKFFKAHGRMGTLYGAAGQPALARKHLQIAAAGDPEDPYAVNMLGWMAYLEGSGQAAIEAFRQADALEPYSTEIQYRWGLAALSLERAEEAADRFRRAVMIDPKNAGAYQGLSHALRQQGDAAAAVAPVARAVRLTRFENPDMLLSLADAYAGVSRWRDAVLAATKAVPAAERVDPKMLGPLRARLEDWQRRAQE